MRGRRHARHPCRCRRPEARRRRARHGCCCNPAARRRTRPSGRRGRGLRPGCTAASATTSPAGRSAAPSPIAVWTSPSRSIPPRPPARCSCCTNPGSVRWSPTAGRTPAWRPAICRRRIEAGAVLVSGYLLLHPEGHDAAMAALERAQASWVGVEAASWPLVEAFGVERFFEASASANAVFANDQEAAHAHGIGRRGCGPAAGGAIPTGGGEAGRPRRRARRRRRALRRRDHADHRARPHRRGRRVRRRGAGVVGTRRRSRRGARARVPGRRHGRGQPRCLARRETRDGRVVRRGARGPRRAARRAAASSRSRPA